ncbi:MAG: radical SAM protein [Acidobacteriota bacterium]
MHITLHLTNRCNMRCGYCYAPAAARNLDMTEEICERAVVLGSKSSGNTGIIFFGGEPLLMKDLIVHTVRFCREHERRVPASFHFKATTNGLLLDAQFLSFAAREHVRIALSFDGVQASHDLHRRSATAQGTFALVEPKIGPLLQAQPYASVFMTVAPEAVDGYAESVSFLFDKGFRYIIASLNYGGRWTDDHMKRLRTQYRRLSSWYERKTLAEEKFYFSPFEKKFATYIHGEKALCSQCHLGVRQISVGPDGAIYPCVQFVQDGICNTAYAIGDVWSGIDSARQRELYELSQAEDEQCSDCAIRSRCEHRCACLNWQATGSIERVSPALCESERVLTPIVDRLGERLFRKRSPMFMQKHYNSTYPLMSYLEDHLISV